MANTRKPPVGARLHKPGCQCPFHPKSRNGAEEALLVPTGDGGGDVPKDDEILDADTHADTIRAQQLERLAKGRVAKKGKRAREVVSMWLAMRSIDPNLTMAEAARRLKISYPVIKAHILTATREGWLRFNDPLERLENQLIPKVIDNLNEFLDQKDKRVTIETAKGTIFREYQESKGVLDTVMPVLAVKIEMTPHEEPKVITGQILGRPKELEHGHE